MTETTEKVTFPRVIVSVPQYYTGTKDDECFYAFWEIARQGWPIVPQPADRCDSAHNKAVVSVLIYNEEQRRAGHPERTFTHIVTLDADHIHPPNTVYQLAGVIKNDPDKYQVLAGLNFRRSKPWDPLLFVPGEHGRISSMAEWTDGVIPVSHAATCAMIIDMRVFEKISYPFFGYEYGHAKAADWPNCTPWELERTKLPGVDIYFCERCHEAGIQIWGDTRLTAPHLAKAWITERQWMAYQQTDEFKWETGLYETRRAELEEHVPDLFTPGHSILYVGANQQRAHYALEMKDAGNTLDLVEIEQANVDFWDTKPDSPFTSCQLGDIREKMAANAYDLVFWYHGPEHVTKDELDAALANCERAVKPGGMVVLGCPWGDGPDGNVASPYGKHVSKWYPEDFTDRGYHAAVGGTKDSGYSSLIAWKRKPKE